jgi:hypothetical protein
VVGDGLLHETLMLGELATRLSADLPARPSGDRPAVAGG